jgi:hypothetical protein
MQVGFAVLKKVTKKSLDGTPFYMVMTYVRDGKVRNSRAGIKIKGEIIFYPPEVSTDFHFYLQSLKSDT